MPIYTVEDTKTGETEDLTMSYSDFETFLKKNKRKRQVFKPIAIGDPIGLGIKKPDAAFQKYVLGKVKETNKNGKAIERRWTINKEV